VAQDSNFEWQMVDGGQRIHFAQQWQEAI